MDDAGAVSGAQEPSEAQCVERAIEGEVALVTGASSGIGRACAGVLVAAGMRVVAAGRREDRLVSLQEQFGDRVATVKVDVRSPTDAERLVRAGMSAFGRVDSLVAAAGIGAYGGILDHSDETLATMVDTNVSGTIWPIRAVVPVFLDSGRGGDIVIIASVAGLRGGGHEAVYAATKFAQVGLAGALDRELAPKGLRVTTICPAATRTEFAMGRGRTPEMPELQTMLAPDDVAAAVLTVLRQPRRLRTQLWSMWSMSEVG